MNKFEVAIICSLKGYPFNRNKCVILVLETYAQVFSEESSYDDSSYKSVKDQNETGLKNDLILSPYIEKIHVNEIQYF